MTSTRPETKLIKGLKPKPAIWLLLSLVGSCSIPNSGPPVGNSIPRVPAEDLSGQPQLISSMTAPCILFFYNPSCQPCNLLLDSLHPYFQNKENSLPKLFLLVKQDRKDAMVSKTGSGFPVLLISKNDWHNVFKVSRTPILLFYQSQGTLVRKQLGRRSPTVQLSILNDYVRLVRNKELRKAPLRCNSRLTNDWFSSFKKGGKNHEI